MAKAIPPLAELEHIPPATKADTLPGESPDIDAYHATVFYRNSVSDSHNPRYVPPRESVPIIHGNTYPAGMHARSPRDLYPGRI